LTDAGLQVIFKSQIHRTAPQQASENAGAATSARVAGRASRHAAQANDSTLAGGGNDPALLLNHAADRPDETQGVTRATPSPM
jgi:hypothetical protein